MPMMFCQRVKKSKHTPGTQCGVILITLTRVYGGERSEQTEEYNLQSPPIQNEELFYVYEHVKQRKPAGPDKMAAEALNELLEI